MFKVWLEGVNADKTSPLLTTDMDYASLLLISLFHFQSKVFSCSTTNIITFYVESMKLIGVLSLFLINKILFHHIIQECSELSCSYCSNTSMNPNIYLLIGDLFYFLSTHEEFQLCDQHLPR